MLTYRVGSYELASGATTQWGELGVTIIGARIQRLVGGRSLHLLCGRFGIFFAYYGGR